MPLSALRCRCPPAHSRPTGRLRRDPSVPLTHPVAATGADPAASQAPTTGAGPGGPGFDDARRIHALRMAKRPFFLAQGQPVFLTPGLTSPSVRLLSGAPIRPAGP